MTNALKERKSKQISVVCFLLTYVLFCAMTVMPHLENLDWLKAGIMCAVVLIAMLGVVLFLSLSPNGIIKKPNLVATLCSTMVLSYASILLVVYLFKGEVAPAPFALCALMCTLLFTSTQCGYFTNFFVLMIYFLSQVLFGGKTAIDETCLYILLSGVTTSVVASVSANEHYRRLTYILLGFALGLVSAVCQSLVYFIYVTSFDLQVLLQKLLLSFGSGLINVAFMFIAVPLFERIFNVVSDFRLAEISSTNAPLLKQLYLKAPGTFNHSLTVANYTEACAAAIGENVFLARACAYYHDIGKMKNPKYYIENQMGQTNPHDSMTPEASVATIKSHVLSGLALAREAKLPLEVQLAIVEHHGTMPMKYFYLKAKRYTDGDLPIDRYCYDGPRPTTKISAILMICDACEAALRANSDKGNAEQVVDAIVKEREDYGQFVNCDITFRDIEIIKNTIIATYQGVHHERIKYTNVKVTK